MQEQEIGVQVVESGKAEVIANDVEEMLIARIPLNANPRKAAYLSNRACGFSIRESCMLASISFAAVKKWRRDDEEFREWESGDKMAWLQHTVVTDLQRMEFMRNFRLLMRLDGKILLRANTHLAALTDIEKDLLKGMGKHYTPQALIAIDRALQPDPGALPPGSFRKSITVTVEGQEVESQSAKQAAAKSLLDQFEANQRQVEDVPQLTRDEPIEGEVLN